MQYSLNQKDKRILTTLLSEFPNEYSFTKLQQETKISNRILTTHLDTLKKQGLINKEINQNQKRSHWKDPAKNSDNRLQFLSITLKGQKKALAMVTKTLEDACSSLQKTVSKMSEPNKIYRYYNEKNVTPLNSVFFELAKVLVQVTPLIGAGKDLENAWVCFRNGRPYWTIPPDGCPQKFYAEVIDGKVYARPLNEEKKGLPSTS